VGVLHLHIVNWGIEKIISTLTGFIHCLEDLSNNKFKAFKTSSISEYQNISISEYQNISISEYTCRPIYQISAKHQKWGRAAVPLCSYTDDRAAIPESCWGE
jgi:hypothetical protein